MGNDIDYNNTLYFKYGLVEALAIQLPEKYGIEILEAFPIPISKNYDKIRYYQNIVNAFTESLRWRRTESINIKKIYKFLNNKTVWKLLDFDYFLSIRLEFTTNPRHPLNGDSLHKWLINIPMPERDSFWIEFISRFGGHDDDNNMLIVRRLIDWAWRKNAHNDYTDESIRLAAQTIAWFLSSQNKTLRNSATKALICLFEDRPLIAVQVLKAFEKVDDMYISERLYAAAYGCAIRLSDTSSLQILAQYVYDTIFRTGNPPRHILWRDYARSILEYALYLKIELDINVKNIKIPYNTPMLEIPSDEVKKLEFDYEDSEFDKNNYSAQNAISHSVLSWDFNRYVISSAVDDFHPVSFTKESFLKEFSKTLKGKTKNILNNVVKMLKLHPSTRQMNLSPHFDKKDFDKFQDLTKNLITTLKSDFMKYCNENEKEIFISIIEPYIEEVLNYKQNTIFQHQPIAKWILKRVFELGWSLKLHGNFDSNTRRWESLDRHENKVERIGKKYQWIAFHEALAAITDNYYFLPDGRYSKVKEYYQGSWQLYIRNIDPTTINVAKPEEKDEHKNLWNEITYDNWDSDISLWLNNQEDIPNPAKFLLFKDIDGTQWVCLETHLNWDEPTPLVEDKYNVNKRVIWEQVRSYFVKNETHTSTWLKKQHFMGLWMPSANSYHRLFSREYYWSPAYIDYQFEWNENNQKVKIPFERCFDDNNEYKGFPTTINHGFESDELSKHSSYIPCHLLFSSLELRYGKEDGTFVNKNNEIVCFDPSLKFDTGHSLWIRAQDLTKLLKEMKLSLVWTLLGEKQHHIKDSHRGFKIKEFSGTYTFDIENVQIKGEINYFKDR
jgi:hypothetical protein